jgi:hypothetical protein
MNDLAKFREIVARAHRAGDEAAKAVRPAPLGHIVVSGGGMAPRHFYEPHGACGFAWVVVKPNRGKFAQFLKAHAGFKKHWEGGISNWIGDYGQEVDRKYAYAREYARVLREAGYSAYANSRLD